MPMERYDRTPPGYVPGGLSGKLPGAGTSPPTASSAPLQGSRGPFVGQFGQGMAGVSQVQFLQLPIICLFLFSIITICISGRTMR